MESSDFQEQENQASAAGERTGDPDSEQSWYNDQDLGSLKKAEETLSYIKAFPEELLSYLGRESAAGYLDWILPAAASCQDKYQIRLMRAAELVQEEMETQIKDDWNRSACMEKAAQADEKKVQQFSERFSQTVCI